MWCDVTSHNTYVPLYKYNRRTIHSRSKKDSAIDTKKIDEKCFFLVLIWTWIFKTYQTTIISKKNIILAQIESKPKNHLNYRFFHKIFTSIVVFSSIASIKGETGDDGYTGSPGDQGIPGQPGEQGETGFIGKWLELQLN